MISILGKKKGLKIKVITYAVHLNNNICILDRKNCNTVLLISLLLKSSSLGLHKKKGSLIISIIETRNCKDQQETVEQSTNEMENETVI